MWALKRGMGMIMRELMRSVIRTMMAKRRSNRWNSSRLRQKAVISPADQSCPEERFEDSR